MYCIVLYCIVLLSVGLFSGGHGVGCRRNQPKGEGRGEGGKGLSDEVTYVKDLTSTHCWLWVGLWLEFSSLTIDNQLQACS